MKRGFNELMRAMRFSLSPQRGEGRGEGWKYQYASVANERRETSHPSPSIPLPVEGRGKPTRTLYFKIWVALLALLAATFGISRVNLSPFNTAIALAIAFVKMALIILFFMHVRYSRRVIWMFVAAGFVWLFIMIELTMSDYLTRGFAWSQ